MRDWPAIGVVAAGPVAAGGLLLFPPDRYTFYPRCPFFDAFGLLCPGCGATRAAAALLHGHVTEALHWNGLFVVAFFGVLIYSLVGRDHAGLQRPPGWLVATVLAVTVVFGVVRNVA